MTVREINKQLREGKTIYAVYFERPDDHRFPIRKARSTQGRLQVLTKFGTWQGIGGNYRLIMAGAGNSVDE